MRADLQLAMKRSGIDPTSLKEIHRIILTTDGTVTDILEAYCREGMLVQVLQQDTVRSETLAQAQKQWLGVDGAKAIGDVLRREVVLRGEVSGGCQLYADSVIALDRLPPAMRDGLLGKNKGIGHLLLEGRVPTFKEVVDCRREPSGPLAKHFDIREDAPVLARSYVVSIASLPIMLIKEVIPEFGR